MTDPRSDDTLAILNDDNATAAERIERLLPLVYAQLRGAAQQALETERSDHTLQATALVHEAYLRLVGEREVPWANRAHFYAAAAEAMRRVLLDHAKARGRLKRGGDRKRIQLTDVSDLIAADSSTIVALDEAGRRLENVDAAAAEVARLRIYAGLSIDQTAEALSRSPRQVDRLWAYARAWLFRQLSEDDGESERSRHPG